MKTIDRQIEYCECVLVGPRQHFLNNLEKAKVKFEALKPEDEKGISTAWGKEYRNIGTALNPLSKLKDPDADVIMEWKKNVFDPRSKDVNDIRETHDAKLLLSKMLENVHELLEVTGEYAIINNVFQKTEASAQSINLNSIRNRTQTRSVTAIKRDIARIERKQKELAIEKANIKQELADDLNSEDNGRKNADQIIYWT